jgi:hypothetical protein
VHSELTAHSCAAVPDPLGQALPSATFWHELSALDPDPSDPQQTCPPVQSQAFLHWTEATRPLSPVQAFPPPSSFVTQVPANGGNVTQQSCVRKSHVEEPQLLSVYPAHEPESPPELPDDDPLLDPLDEPDDDPPLDDPLLDPLDEPDDDPPLDDPLLDPLDEPDDDPPDDEPLPVVHVEPSQDVHGVVDST